jgi:hypothetical protein
MATPPKKRSIGLLSIEIGPIAVDGDMAADAALYALGVTYQDSCVLAQGEPEIVEINSEENDDPEEVIVGKTTKTLEWEIIETSPEACYEAFGGTLTGAGDTAVWDGPATSAVIERSVRIKTKTGETIDIPRLRFANTMNWKFSKKEVNRIKLKGYILAPTKAGVASVKKYKTPVV